MDWLLGALGTGAILYLIYAWARYKDEAQDAQIDNNRLKKTIDEQKLRIEELINENSKLEEQSQKDLHYAIYNEIKHTRKQPLWDNMSWNEIADMIVKNAHYIPINSVQDLSGKDMKKVIKIAWCAERGLLDYVQNWEVYGDKLFRTSINGTRIFLSDEEIKMMDQNNYDFILDVLEEEMAQDVHPEYDDDFYYNINDLILSTINIAEKLKEKAPDSYLCKTELACCDTIFFSMFLIRAKCIATANNRDRAQEFESRYIDGVLANILCDYESLENDLFELFDNRSEIYDKAILAETKNDFLESLIFAFELVIKTDYLENKFVQITNETPLPLLKIDEDLDCRTQLTAFYKSLANFVSPYLSRVQASLQQQ